MKKLFIVVILLAVLVFGTLAFTPVRAASALIACPPSVSGLRIPCTGGGIICVDKHGHLHRWHINTKFHCVAI